MASLIMERGSQSKLDQEQSFEDYAKHVLGDAAKLIDQEVNPSFPTHCPGLPASGVKIVSKVITRTVAKGESLAGRYLKRISLIRRSSRTPGPEYAIECSFPPDDEGLQETVLYEWDKRFLNQRTTRVITSMGARQSIYEELTRYPYANFGNQDILHINMLSEEYRNHNIEVDRTEFQTDEQA